MPAPKLIPSEISKRMGKTRQWFYQRLNGNMVNGKPARFSESDIEQIEKIVKEMKIEVDEWLAELKSEVKKHS